MKAWVGMKGTSPPQMICSPTSRELFELYDLSADPREEHDLAWTEVGLRDTMERELELYRDIDHWP